jgi:hypothetical protein
MMPAAQGQPPPAGFLAAVPRRVFSRSGEDAPIPTFINAVEFIGMGMDVIMDVGVVSPESIVKSKEKFAKEPNSTPLVVDLLVHSRFGMSLQTAIAIHQKLTQALHQIQQQPLPFGQPLPDTDDTETETETEAEARPEESK